MKKSKEPQEPKERKNLTAREFMNIVVDNCIVNAIFFGFFLGILQGLASEYLNGVLLIAITLVITYFAIMKIFVDAVRETFYKGRIIKSEINKVVHSITKILAFLMVAEVGINLWSFFKGYGVATVASVKNLYIISLLLGIVFTILTYVVIMFACRKKFFDQCKNPENVVEE